MRDDQRGAPGQDGAQCLLHEPLARDVEQRGGLVEHQHRRGGEEGAREGDELPLAGGQPPAALADLRVVAVRQRGDELVCADGRGRRLHAGPRGAGLPELDVVRDGAAEQEILLGDHDDPGAQALLGQLPEVNAVEQDAALHRIVEAGEQPRDGRLPGAGGADEGSSLAGRDAQVEPGQHRRAAVAEPDRFEGDRPPAAPAGPRRQRRRLGRLGHLRLLVQYAGDLLQGRRGRLEGVVELRQVLQRVEETLQVEQERDEHADLHAAVDDPEPAVEQHRADGEVADQGDARRVDGEQPRGPQAGRRVALVQLAEDLLVPLLPAECLDRLNAAERFHELHDDEGDRVPGAPVGERRLAPEPGSQPDQRHEPGQHDQAELPVQQQHPGADQQQRAHGRDQRVQSLVEEIGDRVDVGDLPGDDAPRGVALMEGNRQPLEVGEEPAAELQHHRPAEAAHRGDERAGGDRLGQHRDGKRADDDHHRRQVMVAGELRYPVDADAHQPRPGQRSQVGDQDQYQDPGHAAVIRPEQVLEQAPASQPQQRRQARADVVDILGRDAAPGFDGRLGGGGPGAGVMPGGWPGLGGWLAHRCAPVRPCPAASPGSASPGPASSRSAWPVPGSTGSGAALIRSR